MRRRRSAHPLLVAALLFIVGCGRTIPLEVDPPIDASADTFVPGCLGPADCDDGVFCNGVEACLFGECAPSMEIVCDDDDPCTRDLCDERARACISEPEPIDADGDGFANAACGGDDCDDTRRDVNPASPELCDDGVDNDCNLAVDCADGACVFAPFCMCLPTPEICDNRRDDDCDGFLDCDDFDCERFPGCDCIAEMENCRNGFDDDCDGAIDCDDLDCSTAPSCTVCPERDLASRVGDRVAIGSTVGRPNAFTASCAAGAESPDVTFSWRAPSRGRWIIDTIGSDYDTALHVRAGGCAGPEIACDDDSGVSTQSRVELRLPAGEVVVIIVDGFGGSSSGDYVLNVHRLESEADNCADGIDNDRDGDVDCADSECASRPVCCVPTPEICDDAIDQDCDGLVDCADPNCAVSPACCTASREDCANGLDDDCDGLIDCVDPSCAADPLC